MVPDEALGFAQILLGLLLFTLGIPALIIEFTVEESLRQVLHKRIRPGSMLVLMILTLAVVIAMIFLAGRDSIRIEIETLAKSLTAAMVMGFALVWIFIYRNVRISLVVDRIRHNMNRSLQADGTFSEDDLDDLLTLGENLRGGEKNAVIRAIGELCGDVQLRPGYRGMELEDLIRGLQRVVEANGSDEHHRTALRIITDRWRELDQRYRHDRDSTVLIDAACTLGERAVGERSESVALRWLSAIPGVVNVPYRVGTAAVQRKRYSIAIDALSRLASVADRQSRLPRELIALVAYFFDVGPSAARAARDFIEGLRYSGNDIRMAGENAAGEFREIGDFAAADAIGRYLESLQESGS